MKGTIGSCEETLQLAFCSGVLIFKRKAPAHTASVYLSQQSKSAEKTF